MIRDMGVTRCAGHLGVTRAALLAALLVAAGPARAALGEPEASVARDGQALEMQGGAAEAPALAAAGVRVHQLEGSTVEVREFVSPSGTVFAVAWSGVARPDLARLLGGYHQEYLAATAGPRRARGPRRVTTSRLVVETWGHARALHGRAYDPALVPPGASLDDVR